MTLYRKSMLAMLALLLIGAALLYLLPSEVVVTADGEVTFGEPEEEPLEMGWICSGVTDSCVETDLGRVP